MASVGPKPREATVIVLTALAMLAFAANSILCRVALERTHMTMMGFGLWAGERLSARQLAGYLLALSGLVGLLMPGLAAPPPGAALVMLGAGVAWGIYSLRGKGHGDATGVTAGNFMRTLPFALILLLAMRKQWSWDATGVGYAVASGAVTSGIG